MKDAFKYYLNSEKSLQVVTALVALLGVLFALPAIGVPLGLPAEGDAVDYRVPLIQWMIRHGTYPNFPWTPVDDYPMLGEILMIPLSLVSLGFARLVPIAGYVGLGFIGGKIFAWMAKNSQLQYRTLFLIGFVSTISFRPVGIQSNLLMVDNLNYFFLLGSLWMILERKIGLAGVFCALALATRYTSWAPAALLVFLIAWRYRKNSIFKSTFLFCAVSSVGALPFIVRNIVVNNGNPFFPIGAPEVMQAISVDNYGRGTDIWSFLLLPFDILYTNTFVNGFFDYTVGKLFYIQTTLAFMLVVVRKKMNLAKQNYSLIVIMLAFTIIWFKTGQQLRFLIPSLLIILYLLVIQILPNRPLLWLVVLLTPLSFYSLQRDSFLILQGKKEIHFLPSVELAKKCFERAGVGNQLVGYITREGILGFLDRDFVFLPPHPHAIAVSGQDNPPFLYALVDREGYEVWPKEAPCLLRRK